MTLHPHQSESLDAIRAHFRAGRRSVLYQLPTGGGKTYGAVEMIRGAEERGKIAWFIVHRRELVQQSVDAFRLAGVTPGVVQAGAPFHPKRQTQVCAVDTLRNRLDKLPDPDLIVQDECHHLPARTWDAIYRRYARAHWVGLTATPERLDGKGLRGHFEAMVRGPSMAWLIEHGYLCRYDLFTSAAEAPDLSGLHVRAGDYARGELSAAMGTPKIVGDAVDHYRRLAMGRSALLFAASRERSAQMAAAYRDVGIAAAHIDGETDSQVRADAVRDLEGGRLLVLCNVDLFGEGVSVNNVSCIIQMRPTKSLTLHLQQIGRGLRMNPGKENCVILDHAGNTWAHGLPDDDRDWSLDGAEGRRRTEQREPSLSVRICPACFAATRSGAPVCPHCGGQFPVKPRSVEEQAGELEKVERDRIAAYRRQLRGREMFEAKTLEDLEALGKAKGYKPGWARFVYEARQKRRVG